MLLSENVNGIQHLGIIVTNFEKSKKWYENKFGFTSIYETKVDKTSTAFLKLGNFIIEMYKEGEFVEKRGAGHIDHFALDVYNADAALKEALSKGVDVDPSTDDGLVLVKSLFEKGAKFVNLKGPDGVKIELNERMQNVKPEEKYDIKGIAHIGIPVSDFKTSEKFYGNFGFKKAASTGFNEKGGKTKIVIIEKNGFQIELYETAKTKKDIKNREDGHIDHIALDVKDIENAYEEVKKMNIPMLDDSSKFLPYFKNGVKYFTFRGPNMEKVELNQKL